MPRDTFQTAPAANRSFRPAPEPFAPLPAVEVAEADLPVLYALPDGGSTKLYEARNTRSWNSTVYREVRAGEVLMIRDRLHRIEPFIPDEITLSPLYTAMVELKQAGVDLYNEACRRDHTSGRHPSKSPDEHLAGRIWENFDPQMWAVQAAQSWAAQMASKRAAEGDL